MSARWTVRIVCDKCGASSDEQESERARYGAVLQALRDALVEQGWACWKAGRNRRDLCPACWREIAG